MAWADGSWHKPMGDGIVTYHPGYFEHSQYNAGFSNVRKKENASEGVLDLERVLATSAMTMGKGLFRARAPAHRAKAQGNFAVA